MQTPNKTCDKKLRVAIAGLGKMGLSHYAIVNTHPDVELVAVCDSASYVLRVIAKYTSVRTYTDYNLMLDKERLDAVIIATPSSLHVQMVNTAIEHNVHIFCEKPFCLDVEHGMRLVMEAEKRKLTTQVGYHNRFIATFEETKKLVAGGLIGRITHAKAECYGPVVVRDSGTTWRARRDAGGGCLYDYASHGIDLLNYIFGPPKSVAGSFIGRIFSRDVDDEVYSTLYYKDGKTAQICANWSDDSFRKMSTSVSIWGTNGKIVAGRQEISVYLRSLSPAFGRYNVGWNKVYTTSLAKPVWFYLRGEEYSQQISHFIECIKNPSLNNESDFRSALATDIVSSQIRSDATNRREAEVRLLPSSDAKRSPLTWSAPIEFGKRLAGRGTTGET
jgi:scyllo-inositol 2-dehydrogenase (NADP+)